MNKNSQDTINTRDYNDIRFSIRSLEKIERTCRSNGKLRRAAILRKAIAQLKMAQRVE